MRGVVVFFMTLFAVVVMMLFAPPLIEGVGEEVKGYESVDQQGQDTINDIYTSVFVWIPMVFVFGFGVWGVAWYIRRNKVIGRRGG